MDKKTELELKKAKLEQIKNERKKKEMEKVSGTSTTSISGAASPHEPINVDPEKILIECGITTPVLLSNTSSSSLTTSVTSLNNDESNANHLQHHSIPGAHSKQIVKKLDKPTKSFINFSLFSSFFFK